MISERMQRARPRVAIVSDPLVQRGGAERCVEAMAEAFPDAPVFALLYSAETGPASLAARVVPTWLNRIPGAARRHRAFLPLFPAAIESIDLSGYDVILSSHHTVAKGLLRRSGQVHVCYCHTPMRALWERPHEEIASVPALARPAVQALFSRLRVWDAVTALRVDRFVANSRATQRRIEQHYGRESTILNPPIDVERFTPGGEPGDYYLVASRPVAYKRIDVAIAAARRLGRRVIVTGGTPRERVEGVEYRGVVSDAELLTLMRGARALLFPQVEDFGMTPLEVNACGRPVVAYGAGGALETVVDGVTGVLAADQDPDAFAGAIARSEAIAFDPRMLRAHAERFARPAFIASLREIVHAEFASANAPLGDGIELATLR
jgi:glycosyltransferase involved in cell wall biosynthesis